MSKKSKTFILSDGAVNSYGFAINMDKLNTERFTSNPVMLYNHGQLVGKWKNIQLKDGKLTAEPVFMEDESEELAAKIKNRVEKGFVNGASLGIQILSVEKIEGQPPLVEAEVMECSVVDIPSTEQPCTESAGVLKRTKSPYHSRIKFDSSSLSFL